MMTLGEIIAKTRKPDNRYPPRSRNRASEYSPGPYLWDVKKLSKKLRSLSKVPHAKNPPQITL